MATLIGAIAGLVVALTGIIATLGALARDREQLRTLERITALMPLLADGKDRGRFHLIQNDLVESVFLRHLRRESGWGWAAATVPAAIAGGGLGFVALALTSDNPYFPLIEIGSWVASGAAIVFMIMGRVRLNKARRRSTAQLSEVSPEDQRADKSPAGAKSTSLAEPR